MRTGRYGKLFGASTGRLFPLFSIWSGGVLLFCFTAQAGPNINFNSPIQFFTNVAARLLKSELDQDFARIQIYPTNQYTPSLHRLLQVTANLYDSTTNRNITGYPYLPSVFRPLFQKQGANLFIAGYEEVGGIPSFPDSRLSLPVEAKALAENPALPDGSIMASNVYNVPWIIGAKKGFPNFNEFSMQNAITVSRQLEFRRKFWASNGDPDSPNNGVGYTNRLYSIGISNVFGFEAWNSYSNAFPRFLLMSARNELEVEFYEMNSANQGITLSSNFVASVIGINVPDHTWTAGTSNFDGAIVYPANSFLIPLQTTINLFGNNGTNFGFIQSSPGPGSPNGGFDGIQGSFQHVGNSFPIPRWWVKLRSRVRFLLLDASINPMRVVDYVSLSREEEPVDVTFKLTHDTPIGQYGDSSQYSGWYTNRMGNSTLSSTPTVGIQNQIGVGLGNFSAGSQWRMNSAAISAAGSVANAVPFFKLNLGDNSITPTEQIFRTNIFHAPYDPVLTIYQHISWQANDPLVHYMLPDLIDPSRNTVDFFPRNPTLDNLRQVNVPYQPWGVGYSGNGYPSGNDADSNRANKDPLVWQPENWQFPMNLLHDLSQLGQIHRGTPWQTIYLKSSDIATNVWTTWTGNTDPVDAMRMRPVKDWHLASQLVSLLSTNDPRRLLSPNNPDTNAWLNALNGMVVITNGDISFPGEPPNFNQVVMTSNSPQAAFVADAIITVNQTNRSPEDILVVEELSTASPWLNLDEDHLRLGITDKAYEAIPSQLLLLLRVDSFGSITTSNNQFVVQFTGYDDYPYAVQSSSNLVDWVSINTNLPINGTFSLLISPSTGKSRFYRSVLLP